MTARASAPIVHEIVGGFCRICGDTEEWLRETGKEVRVAEQPQDAT